MASAVNTCFFLPAIFSLFIQLTHSPFNTNQFINKEKQKTEEKLAGKEEMGIKDLLRFVKPYVEPIHIKKYAGQRVNFFPQISRFAVCIIFFLWLDLMFFFFLLGFGIGRH